jgi:hypothetical protein
MSINPKEEEMDPIQMIATLLELTKLYGRKAELAAQQAEIYASTQVRDCRRDLHLHQRDRHGQPYDSSVYMEFYHEDEAKKQVLREEYGEVCGKINLLEAMLVEHLPELTYPTPA